jgi:hypothetical protein
MPYSWAVLPSEVQAAPESRLARATQLGAALIGLILLGVMIRSVGIDQVRSGVSSVGIWVIAVFALGGLRFAARARSWMACTEDEPVPLRFSDAFSAVLSADALGNLTPLGLLASEPAKVLLVRRRLSAAAGVSSVAADNVFYILAVIVMVSAGTLVFLRRVAAPPTVRLGADSVLVAALIALAAAAWAGRTRPALLSRLVVLIARLGRRAHVPVDHLIEIEQRFYALLTWPTARLARIAGWQAVFHLFAIAEVYLVLRALLGSQEISVVDAFLLESAGRLILVAFKFIPYRLGVDEAGSALVARELGFDPTVGVTLALVRRLRILAWNAVGVALLTRRS